MGKVRTKRSSCHTSAVKVPSDTKVSSDQQPQSSSMKSSVPAPKLDGIFSKVDIDLNALSKQMSGNDCDDAKSGITSKSMKGMNLKKDDKRKLRHEFFMKKIESIQQKKKEAKAKKKREKTAVVGDMQQLADTLPTLDMLLRDLHAPKTRTRRQQGSTKEDRPHKAFLSERNRKKQMAKDIKTYHQVANFNMYKSDPLSTITEHLRNKLKQEEEMDL